MTQPDSLPCGLRMQPLQPAEAKIVCRFAFEGQFNGGSGTVWFQAGRSPRAPQTDPCGAVVDQYIRSYWRGAQAQSRGVRGYGGFMGGAPLQAAGARPGTPAR